MLTLLKLIQSIFNTLHSDGTPNQVAWGIALGAALGIIPLFTLQNALIFVALVMINISFSGGMLGWALAVPVGFALDPLFDLIGRYLLLTRGDFAPFWTRVMNLPLAPYSQLNNTVALGATLTWLVTLPLLYWGARAGVVKYRATWAPKLEQSHFMRALKASSLYNLYTFFAGN
jgi:uncharacterized protein (TIGR03546 family)